MRRVSSRARLVQKTQDLMREILKIERGDLCEICKRRRDGLGVFHILPVGGYPRLRFHFQNVLLACWYPCHKNWHHDFYKAQEIDKRIKELRGENYKDKIAALEFSAPKMDALRIRMTHDAFEEHLRRLKEARNAE